MHVLIFYSAVTIPFESSLLVSGLNGEFVLVTKLFVKAKQHLDILTVVTMKAIILLGCDAM
jgi:hypothetical protein